jgi:hypothetical protein
MRSTMDLDSHFIQDHTKQLIIKASYTRVLSQPVVKTHGSETYRFDIPPQVYEFTGTTHTLAGSSFTRRGDIIERTPAAGGGTTTGRRAVGGRLAAKL